MKRIFTSRWRFRSTLWLWKSWGHAYADKFGTCLSELSKHLSKEQTNYLHRLAEKLLERTSIIDCGEKSVDSNRFVWDFLEPFQLPDLLSALEKTADKPAVICSFLIR